MFFGWVEGYLVVVAPFVDEFLAVFELLVDVVVGRVAWELFVGGEVVGKEGFVESGVVDGCGNVGEESVPGRGSQDGTLENLVC